MARKDRQFRPDRTGAGILNKLYITRLQRIALLRWFLLAVILVVLSLLQDVIFSRMRIFGATTDFVPCAILIITVHLGVQSGCVFALIASLAYLFSGSAPGFYVMALLVGLGSFAAMLRQTYLRKSFGSSLLCAGCATMLYEMAVFGFTFAFGLTSFSRMPAFFLTGLMTILIIPILYPILNSIEKIGGESWKE